MRLLQSSRSRIGVVLAILAAVVGAGLYLRSVDIERDRAAELARVLVEEEPLAPPVTTGVTLWLPAAAANDVEPYDGLVYAATSAGLVAYDESGRVARRYTTLDGLPENTLTCLERFEGRLFVGTKTSGLVAFDGTRFTRYRFVRPAASSVTALRAAAGELLVGTFDAGLFEYDGTSFTRRHQEQAGSGLQQVTAILDDGPRLYAGSYDAGLFAWRDGSVKELREADGLASDRVTGLAARDGRIFVATDMGVSALDGDRATVVDTTPAATGIAATGDGCFLSSLTRGVSPLADGASAFRAVADRAPLAALTAPARGVKVENEIVWAMTDEGLYAIDPRGANRFERFGEPVGDSGAALSSAHVTALAFDASGRLWAGYFDGGVDPLDPASGARLEHLDDPSLREVNAIVAAPGSRELWIATSKGLATFDGTRRASWRGASDGLVGENVAGLALGVGPDGASVAVATNRGLTVVDGARLRSITAFHGLPNNHVYAVTALGGRTYVGTLGGLAEVDGLRVGRTFTTSTSRLGHNWVSALAAIDGKLYIGTYGGGVSTLLPTGELVTADETAGLEINPGAMLAVDGRLYAGTLDSGLLALDVAAGRWTKVATALGSLDVSALAADASYLYVGTENGITRIARSSLS
jgi:ligand-binding sensor domain-containing protein